ncbi:hypothetical protein COO60DRAFT_1457081 [Scenedesmus sp. NREL 46B-D3]|nr:hypothetical protein COO60DRAFT_1457081 [Scenedesmus sp. NREL 46B-D3]
MVGDSSSACEALPKEVDLTARIGPLHELEVYVDVCVAAVPGNDHCNCPGCQCTSAVASSMLNQSRTSQCSSNSAGTSSKGSDINTGGATPSSSGRAYTAKVVGSRYCSGDGNGSVWSMKALQMHCATAWPVLMFQTAH